MIEKLISLGLTEREAHAYVTLSKFEEATATALAKITKEHRTNIYDSLNGLIKKGLITYIVKNNVRYYKVGDPDKLLEFIKEKEKLAEEIIPDIRKQLQIKGERPDIEVFEGKEGFKSILLKILKEKKTIYGIGASEEWSKQFPFPFEQFMKERAKRNIKAKLLYVKGTEPVKHYLNESKVLPIKYDLLSTIAIFGDYVVFFIWTTPLTATATKSKQLSKSFKKYFDVLWKTAK